MNRVHAVVMDFEIEDEYRDAIKNAGIEVLIAEERDTVHLLSSN